MICLRLALAALRLRLARTLAPQGFAPAGKHLHRDPTRPKAAAAPLDAAPSIVPGLTQAQLAGALVPLATPTYTGPSAP